jgi:hypothetical protein
MLQLHRSQANRVLAPRSFSDLTLMLVPSGNQIILACIFEFGTSIILICGATLFSS